VHVLTVFAHPSRSSFCGQLLDRYTRGLIDAGHTTEVADLCGQQFDPVFRASDYVQFEGGDMPPEIISEQQRIERCDALAFVAPVWWLGLPAILKGWFDRVWSNGWAYEFSNNPEGSLLPDRPFVFLLTAGGSRNAWVKYGYDVAIDTIIRVGVLGWCGVSESTIAILHDTGFDAAASQRHLDYAETLGRVVFFTDVQIDDAENVTLLRSNPAAHPPATTPRRPPSG
jgi:NAD(P)H dehydrogenase (quinone)